LLVLGMTIVAVSVLSFTVRFSESEEVMAQKEIDARLVGAAIPVGAMGD
jgi:hypothetical protein